MQADILTVGSELISGATLNTNAAYLARRLAEAGLPCRRQLTVGDDHASLTEALREALRSCDLLFITGGLGPTFDDLTMEAIADVTERPLSYRPAIAAHIRRFYAQHHRTLQQAALRQAYLPDGGEAIPNPLGTAPGLWLPLPNQVIVALPGVPSEMRAIVEHHLLVRLKRMANSHRVDTRTLRTAGIVELSIEAILRHLHIPNSVQVGLYPNLRTVDIRLTAMTASSHQTQRVLSRVEAQLRHALGQHIYGCGEDTLERAVGALLTSRRQILALAESCTGGLVSDRITNAPGSSRYFLGSVIAYQNQLKQQLLGVPREELLRWGAVSGPVARAMADGVRRALGADIGLALTGIAGPSGGTAKKPVGLVFMAIADRHRRVALRCQFVGDRLAIKAQAAQTALDWLRRYLLHHSRTRRASPNGTSARTI